MQQGTQQKQEEREARKERDLLFGVPTPRVDGVAKVKGAARYPSDEPVQDPAFAYLVTSAIARGRVVGFRLERAKAVSGVLDILTHENVGDQAKPPVAMDGGPATTTLESDRIWYDGQVIAVVVADTYEAAREGANKVEVSYASEPPSATFDSPGITVEAHKSLFGPDPKKGDAEGAFASAPVQFEGRYRTPAQHHNPIELFTTTCIWDGPQLTVYEPSRLMVGSRASIARALGIDPANVRVVSRYVGGAFGSKMSPTWTVWIAIAARRVGRPVKFVSTRDQMFTIATYRAETRHRVRLGADRNGKLVSYLHEGWEVTSRPTGFNVAGVGSTARMYAISNVSTSANVVHADRNTPGFMRAPPETPYMFALESAIDELAFMMKVDPVELRRINDTQTDPVSGLPFSSRSLMRCFDEAAARFGWSRRNPNPGSMRDGDWLVGYGCAAACYPSNIGPAAVRLSLTSDGKATVELAGHEIGNGEYTVVAVTVARSLGLSIEDVTVRMGDSDLPPVTIAGGSNNAASIAHASLKACEALRSKLASAAVGASDSPFRGDDPISLRFSQGKGLAGTAGKSEPLEKAVGRVGTRAEVYVEYTPEGLPPTAMSDMVQKGRPVMLSGIGRKDVTAFAFGAHFVEVRVHRRTREVRVSRVVSAFAGGTIINPTTARSQYMGGVIWGLSSALHEETVLDSATARYVNDNLADYLIPVNADVPSVEIIMVPERDYRTNPLGIKGIGEVGIVGVNAAVANAVFNATGKRVRELPIRAEKLL